MPAIKYYNYFATIVLIIVGVLASLLLLQVDQNLSSNNKSQYIQFSLTWEIFLTGSVTATLSVSTLLELFGYKSSSTFVQTLTLSTAGFLYLICAVFIADNDVSIENQNTGNRLTGKHMIV